MKKVVVTGGSGYIGTEVVSCLLSKKYSVVIVDKKNPPNKTKAIFVKQDLLNLKGIENAFIGADACIHLAAEVGGIDFANKYPAKILKNNSLIDINVLSAVMSAGVKRFVYASSSLVYEKSKKFPLVETDTDMLQAPKLSYGFAKLLGERMCLAYQQELALRYSVCRLFNVYGKNSAGNNDPNGHVIPDLISKVKESLGNVEIWGQKGISRNFTHVTDIAKGLIVVLEEERAVGEIFNIASSKEFTLEEIVENLWKLFGKKMELEISYKPTGNQDVRKNTANVEKAFKLLGWKTEVDLDRGLSGIINSSLR